MSSTLSGSLEYDVHVVNRVHRYHWPGIELNLWMFVMTLTSSVILGTFAYFMQVQEQLLYPIPWYFPYFITVSSLVILYIGALLWLVIQQRLLPSIVMLGAFLLWILWLVGLIVVSVQLWGPGSVNGVCNIAVFSKNPTGDTIATMAWLQQKSICQAWQVVFAFSLVGALFLVWIMVMAYQVFVRS